MSTYLTQFFPGAVTEGAGRTLGTRIVSFQVQNDKLFMFDASDNNQTSGTFNPQVLLDAYPIVKDNAAFNASANAANYILVDPSSGLNKFSMVSDAYGGSGVGMTIDVSFNQRFRALSDGVTWEQVFTGTGSEAVHDGANGEWNALRVSGTLGMSMRRYSEGEGFVEKQLEKQSYFFVSEPHLVPNGGGWAQTAAKWNIKKGMRPITWKISRSVLDVTADPYWAQYDVVEALKKGVTSWNQVFGFEALRVEMASADDSAGDDDTNFILFDEDPSYGAAFANWRSNPNTGEIRGASVYFSSLWLWEGDSSFSDDPGTTPAIRGNRPANAAQIVANRTKPTMPTISWNPMPAQPLCEMWAPQYLRGQEGSELEQMIASAPSAAPAGLTKKQKVEQFLMHILAHEIGHTLGLRHNFKGSLLPPTSSVMEYTSYEDSAIAPGPQAYDDAVIKLLYGISTELPKQPFCTDNAVSSDPDCTVYDMGANPLVDAYAPYWRYMTDAFLAGTSGGFYANPNSLLKYVRRGTPAQAALAWKVLFDGISAPIDTAKLASSPNYGASADFIHKTILNRMWTDAPTLRGSFKLDPPRTAAIMTATYKELSGSLNNVDNVRSFGSRRGNVDTLKYLQTTAAYQTLIDGQAKISYDLTKLSGVEALMTKDLLARINTATSPYFK